jgi:hypothetical protein
MKLFKECYFNGGSLWKAFLKTPPPPPQSSYDILAIVWVIFGIMSKTNQQATINTMFIEYSGHQSFLVTASSMSFKLTKCLKNK